jgi:hypothetical protein
MIQHSCPPDGNYSLASDGKRTGSLNARTKFRFPPRLLDMAVSILAPAQGANPHATLWIGGAFSLFLRRQMVIVRSLVKKRFPVNQKKSSARPGRQRKADDRLPIANPVGTFWRTTLWNLFGIDSRSLAVFRMAMGALLLADLAIRATDLNVMYTDGGMFPRGVIGRHYTSIWNWSFHLGSGSWAYQAMLFGVAAVLALALLVGFQTRLAVIGSWLTLVSLHHRVPPILSGADTLFAMLLFWAMFLPLERVWSLDGWLARRRGRASKYGPEAPVLSVASAAILSQMALMYLFSGIFKSNTDWFSGKAIAGTLANDFYASSIAAPLLQFPLLLTGMTWSTLVLEWAAPVLLFFPKCTAWLRLGIIAALAAMHVGIGICLQVDLFSPVSLAGLALFLPAQFWNSRLLARFWPSGRVEQLTDPGKYLGKKHPSLSSITQGLCLIFFLYVLAVNVNGLPSRPLAPLSPEKWWPLATACGLEQKWGMFDTIPSKDGWYVARAKLKDGSEVDLLRQAAPVDWDRPDYPAGIYPNHRWRKLFREMAYEDELGFQVFRVPVAEFLCRDWNARHTAEKQIAEFDLNYCSDSDVKARDMSGLPIIVRERLVHLDSNGSSERKPTP